MNEDAREQLNMLRGLPRGAGRTVSPASTGKRPRGGRRNPIKSVKLPEDGPNYTYRLGRRKP